jgi:hypothetical protein
MVDLTMLLVNNCHIECQTIGLSITGRAGDERNCPNLRYYIASFLQDSGKQEDFNQEN